MPTAPFLAVDLQRRYEKTSVAFARQLDKVVSLWRGASTEPLSVNSNGGFETNLSSRRARTTQT